MPLVFPWFRRGFSLAVPWFSLVCSRGWPFRCPLGIPLNSLWLSLGPWCILGSPWFPFGCCLVFSLVCLWLALPLGVLVVPLSSPWRPLGVPLASPRFPFSCPSASPWFRLGFALVSLWFPLGFPSVSPWFFLGGSSSPLGIPLLLPWQLVWRQGASLRSASNKLPPIRRKVKGAVLESWCCQFQAACSAPRLRRLSGPQAKSAVHCLHCSSRVCGRHGHGRQRSYDFTL